MLPRTSGKVARVHLKVDTGLGRGGAARGDWQDLVTAARKAEISGRFGCWALVAPRLRRRAWPPHHRSSTEMFSEAVHEAESAGLQPEVRHLANSAATLTRPDTLFDLARPGLAIYGLSPIPKQETTEELGLQPAMTLQANLFW